MASASGKRKGFTLIELMVTVGIIILITALATPSFQGLRQRSAIRGAADQMLSFWNQARFEALKRNQLVKVGVVQSGSGAVFCLGAATTTDPNDSTPCDCTVAVPVSNVCNVARFPAEQSQWDRVTLGGVTLGGGTLITAIQPAVIEPKRTVLTTSSDDGTISLVGPPGPFSYRVNLNVDKFGRAMLCESTSATHKLSDYGTRRCPDTQP